MKLSTSQLAIALACLAYVETCSAAPHAGNMSGGEQSGVYILPETSARVARPTDDVELLNLNKPKGQFAGTPALDNQGLIDGVYACNVNINGVSEKALITINGKANGQNIYVVAAMKTYFKQIAANPSAPIPAPPFRGWGIGAITATGFSGTTWNNQPFSFTLLGLEEHKKVGTYDVVRLSGKIGIDAKTTAQLTCKTDQALF